MRVEANLYCSTLIDVFTPIELMVSFDNVLHFGRISAQYNSNVSSAILHLVVSVDFLSGERYMTNTNIYQIPNGRKSSRVPSSVISNLALRISMSISSISLRYGYAKMKSSVYNAYMTFPL